MGRKDILLKCIVNLTDLLKLKDIHLASFLVKPRQWWPFQKYLFRDFFTFYIATLCRC